MTRSTIDFGIDLGTTNSLIAVLNPAGPEIIRNDDNMDYTPSAVYIRRSGQVYVGMRARNRIEDDPDNAHAEFKLQMGVADSARTFADSGRSLTPPELSAEVLKALRANAERKEPVAAAVITIPAAFELNQSDATTRAAELAGLRVAPLLQEPTAAAYAYTYGREVDRAFWLVYDFGGGTFDAAVISIRDGQFTVANHAGDNNLGGKRIDWGIVDRLLMPAAQQEFGLVDFRRGADMNPGWRINVAKLKAAAEQAKIQLSSRDRVELVVELTDAPGEAGKKVDFEYELTRAQLNGIAEPLYRRSVQLCRRALEDARLGPDDVEKVLLVGGTTIAPAVRELLADPKEGLGIALDQSVDPVTVVALGAAVFAGGQLLPTQLLPPPTVGETRVDLRYSPQGEDPEPLVGGTVTSDAVRDWTGYTIGFADTARKPPWIGPRVPLAAQGTFTTTLRAVPQAGATFSLDLRDAADQSVPVSPATLTYRHGIEPSRPVLPQSIGVGLIDEEMLWIAPKGVELKFEKTVSLRTTVDVDRATGKGVIRIPVLQGERNRADRNQQVGMLSVTATEVKRTVPAGSEVEVTVKIDASQRLTAMARVPMLGQDWDLALRLERARPDAAQFASELDEARVRLAAARARADTTVAPDARQLLAELDRQDLLVAAERAVGVAGAGPDEAQASAVALQELHAALDDVEDALELPEVLADLGRRRAALEDTVRDQATRAELAAWDREFESRREARDVPGLNRLEKDLIKIWARELTDEDVFRVLLSAQGAMIDPAQAQRLVAEGTRVLRRGDLHLLPAINSQLVALLPPEIRASLGHDAGYLAKS